MTVTTILYSAVMIPHVIRNMDKHILFCLVLVLLSDNHYSLMKHFYPHWNGAFLDDSAHIHRVQALTKWFKEDENDCSDHALWPLRSPDLIQIEHLSEIFDLRSWTRKWANPNAFQQEYRY